MSFSVRKARNWVKTADNIDLAAASLDFRELVQLAHAERKKGRRVRKAEEIAAIIKEEQAFRQGANADPEDEKVSERQRREMEEDYKRLEEEFELREDV